jgi:imidazolonepropionase-like amidohydrolase
MSTSRRRNRTIAWVLPLILLVAGAPALGATTALVGGEVHTVSGETLSGATVLMEDTRIVEVGTGVQIPADAQRVDVHGLHVYPGMIAAHTGVGLVEIGSVRGTRDLDETGNLNPNARAKVALNADSEIIPVTRANGVLTVLSALGGGVLTGSSVVWNLDGWNWEDLTVKDPAGIHLKWPSMTFVTSWWDQKSEEEQKKERKKGLKDLHQAFDDARAYMKAKEAMAEGGPHHDTDVRWEAMIPAFRKELPVFIHADEYQQIESALEFAKEQDLDIILVGGRDAWRFADQLAAENVPVILESVIQMPRRSWEPYDAAYGVPKKLHEAGVRFCISTGQGQFDTANTRNLPYHAAMAAAFGLPKEEALRSVTLYPAQILGVADRLGSIEPGKDATLIVTNGDPLDIRNNVLKAWIEGREVDLSSRHTRLYDKYRNRPRPDDSTSQLKPAME